MGRDIRRVAMDFDWPQGVRWKGFVCPYRSEQCGACHGTGYNPATEALSRSWYGYDADGRPTAEPRWCHNITDVEVAALVESGRLMDLTHAWSREAGWVPRDPPHIPTAAEVNAWSRRGIGHDSVNHYICVKARAIALGVFGECPTCKGDGEIWLSEKVKELAENFDRDERYDPPAGEGWQMWETTSEGSPISPVFATSDELVSFLMGQNYSEEAARSFVARGWVPSLIVTGGQVYRDVETAAVLPPVRQAQSR